MREYAERRSEPAFGELVRRHVDLVHSAALRMVGDAHQAQDVSQAVFVALAQNARQLTAHPVLSGWLHRTAQHLAANTVRASVRRQTREQEAVAMNELLATASEPSWETIAPHLDAALGELSEPDRDAVLLRYFEKKSAQEMAGILGISDEAAQKRVNRAVERLREFFAKRGVTIGAGGLVVVISANAVTAAPVGLAVTITTAALAGTAVSTATLIAATKTIAMTTLQKTIITAALATAVGAGIFEAHQAAQLREQNQMLQQQQAAQDQTRQQLQQERDEAVNRLAAMNTGNAGSSNGNNELLKLRGEVGVLQNQVAEAGKRAAAEETKFKEAVSAQAQFQAHQVSVQNATKQLGLALRMFMNDNANQYPTNNLQFNKYLIGKIRDGTLNGGAVDVGSVEFMTDARNGADAPNAIVFRERLARQSPDGTWQRIYGFADGSVHTAISHDGTIDAWEKVNTYSPAPNQ